jgi:hypothetical protein
MLVTLASCQGSSFWQELCVVDLPASCASSLKMNHPTLSSFPFFPLEEKLAQQSAHPNLVAKDQV